MLENHWRQVPVPVANGALQLSSQPLLGQLVWWQVFKHWWGQGKEAAECANEVDSLYPSNVPRFGCRFGFVLWALGYH